MKLFYFSAGVGWVVGDAAVALGAAGFGTGATGTSSLVSVPKFGTSPIGPLVALMPVAGLLTGIVGKSWGAAAASVVFASVFVGVSVAEGWAEAAVGGAGAVAPAGSGAEKQKMSVHGYLGEERELVRRRP